MDNIKDPCTCGCGSKILIYYCSDPQFRGTDVISNILFYISWRGASA